MNNKMPAVALAVCFIFSIPAFPADGKETGNSDAFSPAQIRTVGTLIYDGIPESSPEIASMILRYQNDRSAIFQDWLTDGSMLIRTRFGQTMQVHRVVEPGGARTQLTFFEEPVRGAVAVPNANRYLFTKDTGGSECYQGYLTGLNGEAAAITDPNTRNEAFVCSRDGRLIAWARAKPGVADWDIMLMKTDNPSGRRSVLSGMGIVVPLDFSPDGKKLLIVKFISVTASKRYVLDLESRQKVEINPTAEEISYAGGKFTPDGSGIFVLTDQGSEFMRLVRIDFENGRQIPLSPQVLNWDVEAYDLTKTSSFDVSRDGRYLAYSVNEDGRSRVVILDLKGGGEMPAPELKNAVLGKLRFSPDGTKLAMTVSTPSENSDVWAWNLIGKRLDRWTFSELGGLDPSLLPEVDLIRVPSFDRLSIPAFVYRPRSDSKEKSPVIIIVHGGPEAQMRPSFDSKITYYVNELGAVVVTPNVRGSTGYGRSYALLDNGEKREDAVKDVGAILDWVAAQPDLDSSRIVVSGGSYGGYMSLACLARYNDRIVGAIDEVGISNWSTFLANTEGYRRDARRAEFGDERDPKMRTFFDRISPLNLMDHMTKPLLVIQGANDPRVPKSEADQIVAGLRAKGSEVWYLLAGDEGHGFRKKRNQLAQIEIESLFLRKVFCLDSGVK